MNIEYRMVRQGSPQAWSNERRNPPLYGLVLAGGRSSRMQIHKSTLRYHQTRQVEHCHTLLSRFCARTFVSNREEMAALPGHRELPQIHDGVETSGPIAGVLSAMMLHPAAAWLVLACDMPFVDRELLSALVEGRDPAKDATAFAASDGLPEPLCAIYEPGAFPALWKTVEEDDSSLRRVLLETGIRLLWPDKPAMLRNFNLPEERYEAMRELARGA